MWIWLDDERPAPPGFTRVLTAGEAIHLLQRGDVQLISLDHDLGDDPAGTGYEVAKFLEAAAYHGSLPRLVWVIHSANPVGRERMLQALRRADEFWTRRGQDGPVYPHLDLGGTSERLEEIQ